MMADLNWRDLTRTSRYRFYAVSQSNPNLILSEIENVNLSGCSIEASYYSDARTSGKIEVVGESWPRGSFIRVVWEIPEWGFSRTLGTYLVADDDADLKDGVWTYSLDLKSMLYAMSLDVAPQPWTLKVNSQSLTALKQLATSAGRKLVDLGAVDGRIKTVTMLEPGTSQLSRAFQLAEIGNNRLDVNGAGEVTIERYRTPVSKTPTFTLYDQGDAQGLMFDNLKRSADWLSLPNQAAISYKYTTTSGSTSTDHYITGVANADGATSAASRGYRVTEFESVNELTPATAAQAQRLAQQKLQAVSNETVTYTCTTAELPLWEGDVIWLSISTGLEKYQGLHKCLVQSVDFNFDGTMDLTLRDTSYLEEG